METLHIGHSPDPDDAFMFYAFATEKVTIDGYRIEQVLEDIESLNRRGAKGRVGSDGHICRRLPWACRQVSDYALRRICGQGLRPHSRIQAAGFRE